MGFYGSPGFATKDMYVISRDEKFQAPRGLKLCNDYMELVERFKNSQDELLVIGGAIILNLFTPYASTLDIAEASELVPGDLVVDAWDNGDFELVSSKEWEGGRTLHYERKRWSPRP